PCKIETSERAADYPEPWMAQHDPPLSRRDRATDDPTAYGGKAEDSFDVVVPSLPGFAFSEKPAERGWNAQRTARAWAVLMQRLGYPRYVAQGGDWRAFVTTALAQQHPPGLVAIHLHFPQVVPDRLPEKLTPDQQRAVEILNRFRNEGSGYLMMQSTRPQTIG